jgi:hypothetical protein
MTDLKLMLITAPIVLTMILCPIVPAEALAAPRRIIGTSSANGRGSRGSLSASQCSA